jgi:hypothetical protein
MRRNCMNARKESGTKSVIDHGRNDNLHLFLLIAIPSWNLCSWNYDWCMKNFDVGKTTNYCVNLFTLCPWFTKFFSTCGVDYCYYYLLSLLLNVPKKDISTVVVEVTGSAEREVFYCTSSFLKKNLTIVIGRKVHRHDTGSYERFE